MQQGLSNRKRFTKIINIENELHRVAGSIENDFSNEKKFWPVPDSYADEFPDNESQGGFWERRDDRFHCGVDVYAPPGSKVLAIESGQVIEKGRFTSPESKDYWQTSYYLIIKTPEKINYKYAELCDLCVHVGDYISSGQQLGTICEVINPEKVGIKAPFYIKELARSSRISMLHLELYHSPVTEILPYSGGNYYGEVKPNSIINPNEFLFNLRKA